MACTEQNYHEVLDIVEKSTEELLNELQKTEDVFAFAKENEMELESFSLTELLEQFLQKYKKQKKEIIRDAGLDMTYGYQIFDGRKNPRRDKLLQLAFGFPLTVEETNKLFRSAGVSDLYVRCKRDTICMYCLQQKMTVDECNALLYQAGEETLIQD
ncbi:MAG: hypothetical protein IKB07_04640 [Lachnospiraceae bacterium]|nr:hypothetical protein [Lachnospiraceae bacterium]